MPGFNFLKKVFLGTLAVIAVTIHNPDTTTLGYVGNTGRSTGAHLHYQIEPLDATMIDPAFTLVAENETRTEGKDPLVPFDPIFYQFLGDLGDLSQAQITVCLEPNTNEALHWGYSELSPLNLSECGSPELVALREAYTASRPNIPEEGE